MCCRPSLHFQSLRWAVSDTSPMWLCMGRPVAADRRSRPRIGRGHVFGMGFCPSERLNRDKHVVAGPTGFAIWHRPRSGIEFGCSGTDGLARRPESQFWVLVWPVV